MQGRHWIATLGLLALVACDGGEEPVIEVSRVDLLRQNPADLQRGEDLYAGSCANFCHSRDPDPDNDASYLFDCEWKHGSSDEDIVNVIIKGVPGTRMVAYGNNFPEPEDPWRLVAYLRDQTSDC